MKLYCPACDSDQLSQSKPNSQAVDFMCAKCEQLFQLKSLRSWNPRKIVDAGYEAMLRAIRADRTPNLLVLQYSSTWLIQNLLLIPRVFFSESVIEKRNPLSSQARRVGWVGCNILLSQIPDDGKIAVVSAGVPVLKRVVREEFSRVKRLAEIPPSLRGWSRCPQCRPAVREISIFSARTLRIRGRLEGASSTEPKCPRKDTPATSDSSRLRSAGFHQSRRVQRTKLRSRADEGVRPTRST